MAGAPSAEEQAALDKEFTKSWQHTRKNMTTTQRGELAAQLLSYSTADTVFLQRVTDELQALNVPLPSVQIEYTDVSVTADALLGANSIATVLSVPISLIKAVLPFGLGGKREHQDLPLLKHINGVLKPGRLTLLLGPPQCGKSTFLKLLSGRLEPARSSNKISGTVRYNGELPNTFHLQRTAAYVGQIDNHNPNLTVHETLDYAYDCQVGLHGYSFSMPLELAKARLAKNGQTLQPKTVIHLADLPLPAHLDKGGAVAEGATHDDAPAITAGSSHGDSQRRSGSDSLSSRSPPHPIKPVDPAFEALLAQAWGSGVKSDIVAKLVGLWHARGTLVGDQLARGISGGERKRLTAAELLVGPALAFLMDEISTGLDSATLFSIVKWLGQMVRAQQLNIVVSLLQPPPEVFQLFDDVILMAEGQILYHGPVADAVPFCADLGFVCPTRKDVPSFLLEITTAAGQLEYAGPELRAKVGLPQKRLSAAAKSASPFRHRLMVPVDEMVHKFWGQNEHGTSMLRQLHEQPFQPGTGHPRALVHGRYALSPLEAIMVATKRQLMLMLRDKVLLKGRMFQVVFISFITGSVFYMIDITQAGARTVLGFCFMSVLFMFFGGFPQLVVMMEAKKVIYKHRDNYFMPAYAQSIALALAQLPLSVVEAFVFSTIIYWLVGFMSGAGYWFTFYLIAMASSASAAAIFRLVGCVAPSQVIANALAGFVIVFFIVTSGFAIVHGAIPNWIIWMYWISPYAYALRSYVINELTSPKWDKPAGLDDPTPMGINALQAFDFYTERKWIWLGIGYLWLFFIICTILAGISLQIQNPLTPKPTIPDQEEIDHARAEAEAHRSKLAKAHRETNGEKEPVDDTDNVSAHPVERTPPPATVGDRQTSSFNNGQKTNGHEGIGHAHGHANGLANGHANGHVNGKAATFEEHATAAVAASNNGSGGGSYIQSVGSGAFGIAAASAAAAAATTAGEVVPVHPQKDSGYGHSNGKLQPLASTGSSSGGDIDISSSLQFTPISLVFKDLRYFVPNPAYSKKAAKAATAAATAATAGEAATVDVEAGAGAKTSQVNKEDTPGERNDNENATPLGEKLELLKGITGYLEPGVLMALMGGSGAGKTTLMDVIAGRKTIGTISGEIFVNGHPKEQASWARVMGYVEQQDIHSPSVTVLESLFFSSRLRLPPSIPDDKVRAYVLEVMDIVDLTDIQHSQVGMPGLSGLSVEQRKRLTIAVELVANPSVVFMDEPTSGLDARAAAIVMRAVRNVARNGRTVMVTIHQPSIEIFEAFDSLLLLQRGGRTTYFGPLGEHSSVLVDYISAVPGTPKLMDGYNPATWMLEVTGGSMATMVQAVNIDWPALYDGSDLARSNIAQVDALVARDVAQHKPLSITSTYAMGFNKQVAVLWDKFNSTWWRSPGYNLVRLGMTVIVSCIYGGIYFRRAHIPNPAQYADIQNALGIMYSSGNFLGMTNLLSVMGVVGYERVVFYRERASSMYNPFAYGLVIALVEMPWLLLQTILFVPIMYFLVDFTHEASAFFYYFIVFFETIAFYTIYGNFLVYVTPNAAIAQVLGGACNFLWNTFMGFVIVYPQIPNGWKWMNRASPTTWILYGLGVSQLGDNQTPITFNGQTTSVGQFIEEQFGYNYWLRWYIIAILAAYIIFFRITSILALKYWNFLKR